MPVLIATFLSGLVGALIAVFFSILQGWTPGFFSQLLAGLTVGGVSGLLLGWLMAMHGGGLAESDQKSPMAPAWGVLTGFVYGLSLGPVFCGVCGVCLGLLFDLWSWNNLGQSLGGDLLVNGLLVGLLLGPPVAIVAWEVAYVVELSDMFEGAPSN